MRWIQRIVACGAPPPMSPQLQRMYEAARESKARRDAAAGQLVVDAARHVVAERDLKARGYHHTDTLSLPHKRELCVLDDRLRRLGV